MGTIQEREDVGNARGNRDKLRTRCSREPGRLGPGAQSVVTLEAGTVHPVSGGKAKASGASAGRCGHGGTGRWGRSLPPDSMS